VCGVQGRVSENLPLAGENDEDRKNDEAEQEQLHRDRRAKLDCLGTSHRPLSVPTGVGVVNFRTRPALRAVAADTMLSKVMELGQRDSSIGRDLAGLIALALLPR